MLDTVVTRWCRGRLLRFRGGTPVGRPCAWRERAGPSPRPRVPISIWLANGAKVGTLLWLGTFIVWIVHGSATTFRNLIVCHRETRRTEAPTRAIAGARTVTMATVRPNPPAHLLVLGIVMSEKTYTSRIRWLRAYYSDPLVNSGSAVLVRFVIEANWWARRIVEVPSTARE